MQSDVNCDVYWEINLKNQVGNDFDIRVLQNLTNFCCTHGNTKIQNRFAGVALCGVIQINKIYSTVLMVIEETKQEGNRIRLKKEFVMS